MRFKSYTNHSFKNSRYYVLLPESEQRDFDILSSVFHFKANEFVLDHLIDWGQAPHDPVFRYLFPRKEMLAAEDFRELKELYLSGMSLDKRNDFILRMKEKMKPAIHTHISSFPHLDGKRVPGLYSNFHTIVSLSPDPMVRTCHSYCNYCFRWMYFNNKEVQEAASYADPQTPIPWLKAHPEVSDVLFTGADPLVISTAQLRKFVKPIFEVDSIEVIRISSKSLAYWPFRFTSDKDADELLRLFEDIIASGRHLNFCAHFTHPRELEHPEVAKAVQRIRNTGAIIRTQGPLIREVNDSAETWSTMWKRQIQMGMIPYYMFMEADHSPENFFRLPIAKSLQIFQDAQKMTTGLARTVRGPVFMNDLNRVLVDGVTELNGKKFFVIKSLQSPPETESEAVIKLLPFDAETTDLGNLFELFNGRPAEKLQIF